MKTAPLHPQEQERLEILRALDVFGSSREPGLDALVEAASLVCQTPISLVSLVSADRQWFKAAVGLPQGGGTPREHAFCAHAIHADTMFEIPDAIEDERFAGNPLVTTEPHIRFYAGVPIRVAGLPLGTLCVIDREPRVLDERQRNVLASLAKAASELIMARSKEVAEGQLTSILHSSVDAVIGLDLSGHVELWNEAAAKLFGVPAEQMLGRRPDRIFPEDRHESIDSVLTRLNNHPDGTVYEAIRYNSAGDQLALSVSLSPVKGRDGSLRGALKVLRDRRPQLEALARLEDSQQRYRSLYERTPAIMHSVDTQGCITAVSDRWLEFLGYSREEAIGRPYSDFVRADSLALPRSPQDGEVRDIPCEIVTRGGELREVLLSQIVEGDDAGESPIGFAVIRDLTARRAAERALAAERRRLARVIEATEVAPWEYEIPSGNVIINDRWAELIGYARNELEPMTIEKFESLLHPGDLPLVQEALERHFSGEVSDYECELRMRHRAGHWVWLLSQGRVLDWSSDDEPLRMFGVHLDIQQRKMEHESLLRMSDLLESTGKLARVGGWQLDVEAQELVWTDETKRIHGVAPDFQPDIETAIDFYAPEVRARVREAMNVLIEKGTAWDLEVPLMRADGEAIWVHARGSASVKDGERKLLYGALQDITERRKLLQEVTEGRELLRVTLASIGDAVITTDASGRISWMNPIAERLTGWQLDEAEGLAIDSVFKAVSEQDRKPIATPVTRCLSERRIVTRSDDVVLLSRGGKEYGVEDSAAPILAEDGNLLGAVMVFRDVTEQRQLAGEMRYRAKHDPLTGLINRAEFEFRLERLLKETRENDSEHALLFLDLDHFKTVNDSCGHAIGDELLQKVTTIFLDGVRARDTVARLGGDEFAIILELCPFDQARQIAQELCEQVRNLQFVHGTNRFRVSISIGLLQLSGEWPDVPTVLKAADSACYSAKAAGRDRVQVFESGDSPIGNQRSEMRWASEIETALEENRFVLYRQPIVPADPAKRSGVDVRYELLLRLQREDDELILPGAFIPIAERFHLIARIDRWVLDYTLRCLHDDRLDNTTLCVNISGRSLGDRLFQHNVLLLLREEQPKVRKRLVFEIREADVITNLVDVRHFLEALHELDVGIALDHFGSGMASYGYLKSLPVTSLKLDGQFIARMLDDPLAVAAVRSFIDVAGVLGVPTVAEHIENQSVMEEVVAMGVEFVQGFHIGQPERADWE